MGYRTLYLMLMESNETKFLPSTADKLFHIYLLIQVLFQINKFSSVIFEAIKLLYHFSLSFLQTFPYNPPCSFTNTWVLFSLIVIICIYICILKYNLLSIYNIISIYVLRHVSLVLDDQLVPSSLQKTLPPTPIIS